jgi:hypothetical protein
MWLQAVLTREDIARAFSQITPLRVALGKEGDVDRYLFLGHPKNVELLPDVGVRFETRAKLRWSLAHVRVPITFKRVGVLLRPKVVHRDYRDVLVFGVELSDLDVAILPSIIDKGLLGLVNAQLARPEHEVAWKFMDTLDFHFDLPEVMQPARRGEVRAQWGEVRIYEEALVLAVSFTTAVEREHIGAHAAE